MFKCKFFGQKKLCYNDFYNKKIPLLKRDLKYEKILQLTIYPYLVLTTLIDTNL